MNLQNTQKDTKMIDLGGLRRSSENAQSGQSPRRPPETRNASKIHQKVLKRHPEHSHEAAAFERAEI